MKNITKLNLNLSKQANDILVRSARKNNTTVTEMLKRCIALMFVLEGLKEGEQFAIIDNNNNPVSYIKGI